MAGVSKQVDFVKKRFEYALEHRSGGDSSNKFFGSKNKFAKLMFPKTKEPLRKLLRYLQTEKIPSEILDEIAFHLWVYPDYLKGTYSISKDEVRQELGDHFSEYYSSVEMFDNEFDPEGYYFGGYSDFEIDQMWSNREEHIIAFLNSFTYSISEDGNNLKYFDFRKLHEDELNDLMSKLASLVAQNIQNPPNDNWKVFAETGSSHEVKEGKNNE